jgi:nucleotide-binding universal stress UspA family protein
LSAGDAPWQHEPMSAKRRAYESGHQPKCLVVVDDSPECDRAIYYASRFAKRSGASVVMLRIIPTTDRHQQWLGVADIMQAEAQEEAYAALNYAVERATSIGDVPTERAVREGDPTEQILDVIDKDEDIALLVLAAGSSPDGPGPIIVSLSKTAAAFPIPVAIVPGNLTDEDIEALT